MAINNKPIFTGQPAISVRQITNSTSTLQIFPTGSTNGSTPGTSVEGWYAQKVRLKLFTTDGTSTTSTAAVLRFYISPDSGTTNYQFDEISLPATSISSTTATPNFELPLNITLPSGYCITAKYDATPGASPISTWITTIGGTYEAQ